MQKVDVEKYQKTEPTTQDIIDLVYEIRGDLKFKTSFVFNEGHAKLMRKIVRLTLSYASLNFIDKKKLHRIIETSRQAIKHMAYIEDMDLSTVPPEFQLDQLLPKNFSIEENVSDKIDIVLEDSPSIVIDNETKFDYWRHGAEKLKSLYTYLLNNTADKKVSRPLIEPNKYFYDSFSSINIPIEKTKWLGSIKECFYMMYMANNKSHRIGQERLDDVCYKLFEFIGAKNPTKKNLYNSYNTFMEKSEDELYAQKKFSEIQNILRPLGLLTIQKR